MNDEIERIYRRRWSRVPQPKYVEAQDLRIGDEAYAQALIEKDGLLYVRAHGPTLFRPSHRGELWTVDQHIRRVKEGVLFDCETPKPFVMSAAEIAWDNGLLPVVGTFRSKEK